MASRTPVGSLSGHVVELVPLRLDMAAELAVAASIDRDSYGFTEVPDGPAAMTDYVTRLLGQADAGVTIPFAQRLVGSGRYVGCTRYIEPRYWRGRAEPDEVEIGGTWLSADVQRTAVNTDAKLVLLANAFETWGCWRVALCTDEGNGRSRAAIERIGATFEGVLRNHRPSTRPGQLGRPRQTAVFSIIDSEWPAVKERLIARLTPS